MASEWCQIQGYQPNFFNNPDETRNEKYDKSYAILNHRYTVKS